jgi:SAM-dependent methyltransferase
MENFPVTTVTVEDVPYRFYSHRASCYETEMIAYAKMAKEFLNKPFDHPKGIVGNYEWHEEFPYEKYLLNDLATEEPLVNFPTSTALDFGCGVGRMVNRVNKLFKKVDGIDVSEYALEYARSTYPASTFYTSSGIDVGDVPADTYDLVYSTISIQHIPCWSIRDNIFRGLHNALKPDGWFSIQMAFNPTIKPGVWSPDSEHASYNSDFWNAKATNGHADVVINTEDLPTVYANLSKIFSKVRLGLVNVDNLYGNLNGQYHSPYWASDWLFIQGQKV